MEAGWYPDPDSGQRRFFDGDKWLEIPDPNSTEADSFDLSGKKPKRRRRKLVSMLLVLGGTLLSLLIAMIVIVIIQLQGGNREVPTGTDNDFQQLRREQCFTEKMNSLRAVVQGDAYAVEARLICNSLYP